MMRVKHKFIPDKAKENQEIIAQKLRTAKKTSVLSLNNLTLSIIPQGLFQLSQIHTLDLGFNNITELPLNFFSLKNLQVLHLNNNPLQFVQIEISQLINLEVLNLSYTYVKFLPREMVLMKKLKAIDLSGCEMQGGLAKYSNQGIDAILQFLQRKYDRSVYREKIVKKLKEWVYVESSFEEIQEIMDNVMGNLKDVHTDDLRRLLRNLNHIFPMKIEDVDNQTIKTKLMQRVEMKSVTKKDLFPDME